jgi:hypothetical protein
LFGVAGRTGYGALNTICGTGRQTRNKGRYT